MTERLDRLMYDHMQESAARFLFYSTVRRDEQGMLAEIGGHYSWLGDRLYVISDVEDSGWPDALREKVASILGVP